jgi:chemotaxis protein histidine kinase CheA
VVKRLVEAQNGSISFESEAGKGTKFKIELPTNQ